MTYVDTNVIMYAVGRPHPLRDPCRRFFRDAAATGTRLCTSAEAVQELLHAYLPVGRLRTLDAALTLCSGAITTLWPVEPEDVFLARQMVARHPGLGARDLVHLACCRRRGVRDIKTHNRALAAAAMDL